MRRIEFPEKSSLSSRPTRLLLLVPLAVVALALAGCGGESSPLDSDDIFGSAATNTVEAGSEQMSIEGEVTLGEQTIGQVGQGVYDNAAERGRIEQTLSFAAGDAEVEQISNEDVTWLKAPLLFQGVIPSDKEWFRIRGGEQTSLRAAVALTPRDLFAIMRLASTEVEEVGTEEIEGVEVTHYRAPVDADKLAADSYLTSIDAVYEPLEIWVDDDGVVRRMVVDFTALYDPDAQARTRTVVTSDFSEFGTEVAVTLPPERLVVNASDVAEG
jgi:hypothetical protein